MEALREVLDHLNLLEWMMRTTPPRGVSWASWQTPEIDRIAEELHRREIPMSPLEFSVLCIKISSSGPL